MNSSVRRDGSVHSAPLRSRSALGEESVQESPLRELAIRELIALLARTEDEMRARVATDESTGADLRADRRLRRRQKRIIRELRRRGQELRGIALH